MNLSPVLGSVLRRTGLEVSHWSEVGRANASDSEILEWARGHDCVVVTQDLDMGRLLAIGGDMLPSVIQLRMQNLRPDHLATLLIEILRTCERPLRQGVLVTVTQDGQRLRLLPLR
jgi:predicted nuclease of predicted toxin-antitoxin system